MGLKLLEVHFWTRFYDKSKSFIKLAENCVESSQKDVGRINIHHLPTSFREKIQNIILEGCRQDKKTLPTNVFSGGYLVQIPPRVDLLLSG